MSLFFNESSIILEKKIPKQADDYAIKDDIKDKKANKDTSSEDPEVEDQANDYSAGNDVRAKEPSTDDKGDGDPAADTGDEPTDYNLSDDDKDTSPDDATDDNDGNDDSGDSNDYSLPNDDDNTDDSGNDSGDDSGDGGDEPNDYSLDGDSGDSGDDSEDGGDSGDDSGDGTDDSTPEAPTDPVKDLENQIYGTFSAEQNKLKDRELGRLFSEMYNSIGDIQSRLDLVPKTENNLKTIDFCGEKIQEIRELIFNYIMYVYNTNSYIKNFEQYYLFLASLKKVQEMLAEVIEKDNTKDQQ